MASDDVSTSEPAAIAVRGYVLVTFAFDVGFQVDLDAAEPLVREATRRRVVRARRPAPVWFDYSPPPLRLELDGPPVRLDGTQTAPTAELLLYDFGAAVLTYRLPLPTSLDGLPRLAGVLLDNDALLADARTRLEGVLDVVRPAVERPGLAETVEDYVVYAITEWDPSRSAREAFEANRRLIASVLEAEDATLADEQTARSTEASMSYTDDDLAVVNWNAAVLFDAQPDDVIAVLQHANVELLELRVLDLELDAILDHADETLSRLIRRRLWPGFASGRMMHRVAVAQTDAAVMFEGVNNAIKLLGNQYLARLYRLAASRFDLPAWHESVGRKLEATEGLYQKMSDAASIRRLETLEWVIIILIAVSIVLPFTPWY